MPCIRYIEKIHLSEVQFQIQLQFDSARHVKARRKEQKALAQRCEVRP